MLPKRFAARVLLGVACGLAIGLALGMSQTGRSLPPDTSDRSFVPVSPPATSLPTPYAPEDEGTLVGAGDIAGCAWVEDDATADLLDSIPGVVFTLGDNVYPGGSAGRFRECFGPTWGRHRDRIRPVLGTRDDFSTGAAEYFIYFGAAAGERDRGYYAYDVGNWRVYAMNSVCELAGGCGPGSEQYEWLAADLIERPSHCTLGYWHHPPSAARPGSTSGDTPAGVDPLFELLHEANAEIVLAAGAHNYQRFAPLAPDGNPDPAGGVRLFIVGTGGAPLDRLSMRLPPTVEASSDEVHGVLKLALEDGTYDWEFVSTTGDFSDDGSGTCRPPTG